jgi:general secretion pathway protein D
MKTLMTKPLIALMALALCFAAVAQNQPAPSREQEQPDNPAQPDPAELAGQLLRQNVGGTNGDATAEQQQAVGALLQELINARDALNGAKPDGENAKPGDERAARPIRGQGTRGTTGSGTNAQSLASLLTNAPASHTANGGTGLRLNFRNASLSLVLDYLSDAAGFVISANSKVDLQGKVTVWSNQLVDRNEAIALLNSALISSGYAATVEGNLLNIYVVDATNTLIEEGIPGGSYTNIPPTKDLVTQIVYVHNVEANQLITSLQPLMPTGTSMNANQGANAIIITDTKANIRRMAQLVKALDTASVSASGVHVFALQYADATALAQVVTQLFQSDSSSQGGRNRGGFGGFPGFGGGGFPGGGGGGRGDNSSSTQAGRVAAAKVTAVADERSNSLVVSAAAEQMTDIEKLVNDMDVNVDDLTELKVFRLRFADPQETADQLASLFPDPTTQQNSRGNSQSGFRGFFGGGGFGGNNNRNSTTQSTRSTKQTRVTAVSDPRTGSVIVSASHETMGQIAGIVEELDSDPAKKKKVYVIKVENRDPQEVVEDLQSVIATESSGGNFSTARSSSQQSGSQLNTRQQNNTRNQGNNNNTFGTGFGTGGTSRTGR